MRGAADDDFGGGRCFASVTVLRTTHGGLGGTVFHGCQRGAIGGLLPRGRTLRLGLHAVGKALPVDAGMTIRFIPSPGGT